MTSLTKATENIDVLILCGGKGTRLQSVVSDRPKSMADVEDRPFLDILIEYIALFGFRRIILCVGYMKDMIKNHYTAKDNPAQILYSEEDVPLGTGGAVKNARALVHGDRFIVVNGDTFCSLDYRSMVAFHDKKNAMVTVSLVAQERRGDVGLVVLDDSARVTSFSEKGGKSEGFVNTGIYLFDSKVFELMPAQNAFSMEYDVLPKLANDRLYGYVTDAEFIDIGTPERYSEANTIISRIKEAK